MPSSSGLDSVVRSASLVPFARYCRPCDLRSGYSSRTSSVATWNGHLERTISYCLVFEQLD